MLINLEGPPLKSLLCQMGGATDASQASGTTLKSFEVLLVLQRHFLRNMSGKRL